MTVIVTRLTPADSWVAATRSTVGGKYDDCSRLLAERAKEADLMGPSVFAEAEAQLDEDCSGIDYPLAKRLLRALKASNQAVADLRREFAEFRKS